MNFVADYIYRNTIPEKKLEKVRIYGYFNHSSKWSYDKQYMKNKEPSSLSIYWGEGGYAEKVEPLTSSFHSSALMSCLAVLFLLFYIRGRQVCFCPFCPLSTTLRWFLSFFSGTVYIFSLKTWVIHVNHDYSELDIKRIQNPGEINVAHFFCYGRILTNVCSCTRK